MHTIQRINFKTDNCYLIINNGKAVLFDTCSAEAYDTVLAECSKYDMQLIVLSHVHFDHAENAVKLAEHFKIPVAFHAADEELFESFDKQPLKSWGLVGLVVLGVSRKVLRQTPVQKPENYMLIKEGDSLSEFGIDAKIIEVPGHTKGSVAVDVAGESLIVGDALDNWIFPATGHLYSNKEDLKKSAEKIKALGARTIYYGHGKPTHSK